MSTEEDFSWDDRRCPVYSLAPMSFFGLQMETAAMGVAIVALCKPAMGMFYATALAVLLGWAYERASAGKMPNYVAFWASAMAATPFARRYLPFLEVLLTKSWSMAGLPPAPGAGQHYEP